VDSLQVYSKAMNKNVLTLVVKPDHSDRFPAVYVLHGYSGHPYRTLQLDMPCLRQLSDLYNMAFVLPDGDFDKWYLNSTKQKDAQYETFLGEELPAYVDQHYPTIKSRFARAIIGWSMGGFGALHIGGKYPAQFGAIGSICGAVSLEPYITAFGIDKLIDAASWKQYDVLSNCSLYQFTQQRIILTCGYSDPFLPYNRALHVQFNHLKIDHSYMEQPGGHDFEYWSEAAAYVVLFMHKYFVNYENLAERN
jgi:S-formylglutathione hydrolase FrmB